MNIFHTLLQIYYLLDNELFWASKKYNYRNKYILNRLKLLYQENSLISGNFVFNIIC